jgi:hypothetical protein
MIRRSNQIITSLQAGCGTQPGIYQRPSRGHLPRSSYRQWVCGENNRLERGPGLKAMSHFDRSIVLAKFGTRAGASPCVCCRRRQGSRLLAPQSFTVKQHGLWLRSGKVNVAGMSGDDGRALRAFQVRWPFVRGWRRRRLRVSTPNTCTDGPLAGENLVPIALQGVRSFAMKFWLPAPVRSWRRRLSQSWSCGTPSKDGCVSFSAYRRGPLTLRCAGESEVKCLPTVLTN